LQVEKRGRIETDEVWAGNILITGDVVIERDITVRVMAGTRIIFSDSRDKGMDCKRRLVKHFNRSHAEFEKIDFGFIDENAYSIVVRGSFLCNGTQAAGIRIGSRQWRGSIIVGSLRGSSGNFYAKNTAIKYAGIGLWGLKNTKIDFVDGEISSSTFGFVAGGEFNSIRGSNILKNNVGIVSLGSMEMHCSGNTVKNSRYYGILFGGSEYNSKVSIAGNKVISNDVGMHVAYAKNADINNNKIIRNRVGMYCRKSKNIKIDRNIIRKSNTNGLILDMETEHTVVSGNRFHNNGELAVECMSNAGAVLKDNKLSGESTGFCLRGKCRVTIEGNTIRGNQFPGSWGIRCSEMSRTAVLNNVIEGFENAIKADAAAAADIRGNRIKTDNMGIDSGGESTVSFSGNTVQSKTVGIYAHADSHIDVKSNKITSKIGIEIRDLCCVNFSETFYSSVFRVRNAIAGMARIH